MIRLNMLLGTIMLFPFLHLTAQDLSKHQWQNRLVLILSENEMDESVNAQMKVFNADEDGMQDRKLVVYHITPDKFKTSFPQNGEWQYSEVLFDAYKKSKTPFEVILIGLDGGVKKRKTSLLSTEELFGTIDVMPMRRAELRKRN